MQITIGSTSDDRRKLVKSWSGRDVTVQPKQPCDILRPTFILSYASDLLISNYLYCPDFSRYYFIDNIQVTPGNRFEISCTVDVLMSYRNEISRINCVVTRQEHSGLTLVPDSSIMLQNYTPLEIYNFPNSFDVAFGNYVLQVIGGD